MLDNNESELVDLEITNEIREKHEALLSAIKSDDVETAKHLLVDENIPMYIPCDDPDQLSEHADPICLIARNSDNTMLEMLLEQGADPFYKFDNYEKAISIVCEKRNDEFLTILFNHLVVLDTTPRAMKKLWEMEYPFTKDAVLKAYEDNNFEALALFSKINKNKFTHFWLEHVWVLANNNNDVRGLYQFQNMLITKQKDKSKIPFAAAKGTMMAMANRNHELVKDLFVLGVNPHVRAGNLYGKMGARIHNKQSKCNLFKMAVMYNYDAIAKQLLDEGYKMKEAEAEDLFDFMLTVLIQPSTESTSFHRTVKVLVDNGLTVSKKHIKDYEAKMKYAKEDQIKEYENTLELLTAKVGMSSAN